MKKLSALSVLAVVATLTVTACSGSDPNAPAASNGSGGNTLVIALRQGDNKMAQPLVDLWNSSHSQKARLEQLSGNTADQQHQQLTLELSSKSPTFDVVGLDVIWTGEFAKNGWVDQVDDLAAGAKDKVYPGPLASGTYKSKQYAMPLLVGAGLLYYRTDVTKTAPPTWDDLKKEAAAAKSQNLSGMAGQGAAYEGMVCDYLEYLWAEGGDLFNADQSKVVFGDNDAPLKALQFMKQNYTDGLYAPGFNTMTEPESLAAFQNGKTAFLRHWASPYATMQSADGSAIKDKFDIAPLPSFGTTKSVSALGGMNLAVNAYSKNKSGAKDFVSWASTDPAAQELLAQKGLGPALKSVYSLPAYSNNRMFQVLGQVLPDAKARPAVPEWSDISAAMSKQLFAAYTGQSTPEDAIKQIRAALDKAVAK